MALWSLYILVLAGAVQLGTDAQTTTDCCEPFQIITATVNVLKTIRITCTPQFVTACSWVITAPPGSVVGVEFSQVVIGTANEILHVNDQRTILRIFTNERSSVPLTIGGTSSTVQIIPDATSTPPVGGADILEFKFIAAVQTLIGDTATACENPAGQTIDLNNGNTCIASPLFPLNYPDVTTDCKWTIETNGKIKYTIPFFHLEELTDCNEGDFLTITVGGSAGQQKCNRQLQGDELMEGDSPVIVDFHFDDSDNAPGFLMCFENIVHGGYSSWGSWNACSVTCASGVNTRTRECNNPTPQNGGHPCSGSSSEIRTCTESACPIHGGYSSWGSWNACSVTCASGVNTRTRECNNPTPQNSGHPCSGSSSETRTCTESACPNDDDIEDVVLFAIFTLSSSYLLCILLNIC